MPSTRCLSCFRRENGFSSTLRARSRAAWTSRAIPGWRWHSAEETEHKAVCFDLYRFAGGGWLRRSLVFVLVTLNFSVMFSRLYFSLLHRDGCLEPSRLGATMMQGLKFFFARSGIAWHLLGHGLRYLSPWFHPWNQDNRQELQAWLLANQARLRAEGRRREG